MTSKSLLDMKAGLRAVDDVLGYAKTTSGKPLKKEKSLFVASVALSYAVWENYIEEVAIEAVHFLAANVSADSVPPKVRDWVMKSNPSAWDLAVHPGWKALWIATVETRAKGDASAERDFGILTADAKAVNGLFERVGVPAFDGVSDADMGKLGKLVAQRGQIVHTGKAPTGFYKQDALDWRTFVEQLGLKVDSSISVGAKLLTGDSPW